MSGMTSEELQLGMGAELARTYDQWDIYTFAAVTGDLNPAHVDQAFAEQTIFKGQIAHGMLTASLISAVLGTKLPGPGTIYLAQELKFLKPVRIGDTVTAKVTVIELVKEKNLARLQTTCANQRGERLLEGTALVMPPKTKLPERREAGAERTRPARPRRQAAEAAPRQPARAGFLVGQRMAPDPLTISPDAFLAEARALLDEHQVRHLPVVEGKTLVGIITDRDIRQASLPGSATESETLLGLIKVREVMSRDVATIRPEASIGDAAKLLLSRKIGGLPVVKDGRLVGIITVTDALAALAELVGVR